MHIKLHLSIQSIMDTWTQQMGFPLVRIRLENRTIRAVQERFLLNPGDNETTEFNENKGSDHGEYQWYIPLSYVTDVKPRAMQLVWMNKSDRKASRSSFSYPITILFSVPLHIILCICICTWQESTFKRMSSYYRLC